MAICGDGHSDWSEVADFWTTTTPATIPYTQTFEENDADRANWVLVNGNEPNYFMYGNIPGSTTGKALMITQDGSTNTYLNASETSNYSTVWAYRDIQFPETTAAGFMLTLNWKCFGEVDYDFGEMFIGNATEVTNFERNENVPGFIDVNTAHYTPAGLTKLDRFVNKAQMQTGAYIIPSSGNAGQVKRLYFLWTNDSLSGAETPLAIDNIHNWGNFAMTGHSGEATDSCATSKSYDASSTPAELHPDNWLITPAISIPANSYPMLTFWVCAQDASWPQEHYGVYVTTSNDYMDPNNYTLLFEETLDANGGARAQGAWKQKTAVLTAFAGQTVHIAFRHFNCTNMFYINLDDVAVEVITEPTLFVSPEALQFTAGALNSDFGRKNISVNGVDVKYTASSAFKETPEEQTETVKLVKQDGKWKIKE